jgi:hypothetical protein
MNPYSSRRTVPGKIALIRFDQRLHGFEEGLATLFGVAVNIAREACRHCRPTGSRHSDR